MLLSNWFYPELTSQSVAILSHMLVQLLFILCCVKISAAILWFHISEEIVFYQNRQNEHRFTEKTLRDSSLKNANPLIFYLPLCSSVEHK